MAEVLACHKNDRQNEPRFLGHFVTDKSKICLRVFFFQLCRFNVQCRTCILREFNFY